MLVMLRVAVTQSSSVLPVLWIMYMSEHGEDSVIEYHDVYFSLAGVWLDSLVNCAGRMAGCVPGGMCGWAQFTGISGVKCYSRLPC